MNGTIQSNNVLWSFVLRWLLATWQQMIQAFARLRRRRVPVIRQMSISECGAACLAMILNYHGHQIDVAESAVACGSGERGITAQQLARAARRFGLRVRAYKVEPAELCHVTLPSIVHWNFRHFVVLERWSPREVELVDPLLGRRRVSATEFDEKFTGVVLTFEPGVHFERRRTMGQPAWLRYVKQFLLLPGMPKVFAQLLGVSLVLQLLGLSLPVLTQLLIDQVLPFRIQSAMSILGIGMVILILAQTVSGFLRASLLIFIQARLDWQLVLGFFEHLLALPFEYFQKRTSGDLMMRVDSVATVRETLTSQTLSAVLDSLLMLTYLIVLLVQSPKFGLLTFAIGLVQVCILLGTTKRVQDLTQQELLAQVGAQNYLVESLTGIETIKASGTEERSLALWSDLFFNRLNITLQREQLSAVIDTAITTIRTFSPVALLWYGALQVLDDEMTLGTMLALNALAVTFLAPLASLISNGRQLQVVGAHLNRIADVLDASPEQDLLTVEEAPPLRGRIRFHDVNFRYDPNAPWVLRNLSFTIEAGQKVAIVGRTGSGKSTLAKLLLGLYAPETGTISYDGIPLQRLNYSTLRNQFGVVLQDAFLFNGSIRHNIAFHDSSMPFARVVESARLAAIHEEILQMPMGYETMVTENGKGFSGGQRQRLSIARALAHNPACLLLDEATSHLDTGTEARVEDNMRNLACTRVVIAHRLSTVRDADLILVLDEGRIVEQGTHAQLVARNGRYAMLVHDQFDKQEEWFRSS